VEVLVWLLVALAAVDIYRGAQFVVEHVVSVLILFVFAAIVALVLTPVVDLIQRIPPFRSHRAAAVLTLYVAGLAILAAGVGLLAPRLATQARELPALAVQLQGQLARRGLRFDIVAVTRGVHSLDVRAAFGVISGLVSTVTALVLIVVISAYLLIEGRVLIATARNLFPESRRAFDFTALSVAATIGAYVRGQLVMCALIGTYTGLTMTILGVHYAVLLGMAAFLLEFVPIAGAMIAMALAVVVALLQSPVLALFAAAAGLLGHAIDAYLVGPRVQGRVTRLHPLVAMAAVVLGAELAGILGALFAIPVAAMANIHLGALYRARRGEEALSTHPGGAVATDRLPRLSEEIGGVEEGEVVGEPVPHQASAGR
jgi:predicted PurR-regulated permease PerM